MDHRLETSRNIMLMELEKINNTGSLNTDSLCNMGKLIDGLHHIEEIKMLEEVGDDYYPESYGRGHEYRRRRYGGRYEHDPYAGEDMRSFLEESMRRATTDAERERIRRLMNSVN